MAVGAAATGRLATPAERVTRCTPAGWSAAKDADEVKSVVIGLLAAIGVACAGIAFDNGKEFARHAEIASALKADVFFARPCHSRERGTNESTNGPIRRLFPKEESFAAIGEADPRRIDAFLNDRPRKCRGRKTPREAMDAFLAAAA
jgi:IS30 family transposase